MARPLVSCLCVTLVALGVTSCCRSRGHDRLVQRRTPALPPPVISEGPSDSEVPITLPPATLAPQANYGSAYGLAPVAPLGSTGTSRDIRYPRARSSTLSPGPLEPRSRGDVRPVPMPERPPGDLPVNVAPHTSNGNGQKPPAAPRSDASTPTDEATGIPHYTIVEANVATGGQPTLDGMKWLKERGFAAVLNLLPDADADPAEPSMVRELGLEYISLPVTAATISRGLVETFNQIVDDAKYRPLFIHDSTGARTGAMWYLHRVTVDRVPDDRARNQAKRIGLEDSETELWLAIQRYLSENQ